MAEQLSTDALIEEARGKTGLERFDSESFREGLEVLVRDVNAGEARPAPLIERLRNDLVRLLSARLQTTDYLDKNPELLAQPIEKPVFVFGVPRTGTTLLSNLLNCDPARRSALTWEIDEPIPPATTETLKTDPRALARLAQEKAMLEKMPEMGKYYRNSAIYPNECIFFMAHDFKALALESRGQLPNYRDWLFSTDMHSAYQYHKRFLQILQSKAPGVWNLKMPSHALWLDTLLDIYPDARLVWTHRDPFTAMGSFCSIISLGHKGFTGKADVDYIREDCMYQAVEHANRIMDFREKHGEDRIIDVHYAELTADPLGQMKKLYAALGDTFTPEAEAGMQTWLDDNPQDKFGKHEYKLAQFGMSLDMLKPVFERYLSKYDVALEGA